MLEVGAWSRVGLGGVRVEEVGEGVGIPGALQCGPVCCYRNQATQSDLELEREFAYHTEPQWQPGVGCQHRTHRCMW